MMIHLFLSASSPEIKHYLIVLLLEEIRIM